MKTEVDFKSLFAKIGFTSPEIFRISKDNKQFIFKGRYEEEAALVKLYDKSIEDKSKNINEEFKKTLFLSELIAEQNIGFNMIKVLAVGEYEKYSWVIRQFIEGEPLGAMNQNAKLGVDRYANINNKFYNDDFVAEQICQQLNNFSEIKLPDQNLLNSERFKLTKKNVNELEKLANFANFKNSFDFNGLCISDDSTALSIKDLTPSNILISKDKKVYLFDFEWLGLDNQIFDLTMLWLFSHNDEQLSKKLKNLALVHSNNITFSINAVRIIFFYLRPALLNGELNKYKNHPWINILKDNLNELSCQK